MDTSTLFASKFATRSDAELAVEETASCLGAVVAGNGSIRATLLRRIADGMGAAIRDKRRPRLANTPKRQREAESARIDANQLERVRDACLALADAHENGSVPAELADLRYRKEIEPLVRVKTGSNGYYDVHETGERQDNGPVAVLLRDLVKKWGGEQLSRRQAEREAADNLTKLENSVRFSDIPGFFPTPAELVEAMIQEAELSPGMKVLEPSAGKGDIAEAARAAGCDVLCMEINHTLTEILKAKGLNTERCDFTEMKCIGRGVFDRVLMNPPFERGQDAAHVRWAFGWLKPGGRIVAIVSAGAMQNDRAKNFQQWLFDVGGVSYENSPDAFKHAFKSTGVRTWTIVIDKPE